MFKKGKLFLLAPLLALAFAVGVGAPKATAADPEPPTPIDVYILAGQSNADGVAEISSLPAPYDTVEYKNVWIHRNNVWREGVKAGLGGGAQYFGPELGIAEFIGRGDKKVAIIKWAIGGTAITKIHDSATNWHGTWDGQTAGSMYTTLFNRITNGLNGLVQRGYAPEIKGMFWMQGEQDGVENVAYNNTHGAGADYAAGPMAYEHNLTEFFAAVRARLELPALPIVFGEVYEYSQVMTWPREILAAQHKLALLPDNYLVETGDLYINPNADKWHWQGKEMLELGRRFADAMYRVYHPVLDNTYDDGYAEGV
ncbi:MAG: sialate O-acetylesterase [Clostridiales bacterium]|nr:sialate O-acetylesterase [Clostridiales bacterium]